MLNYSVRFQGPDGTRGFPTGRGKPLINTTSSATTSTAQTPFSLQTTPQQSPMKGPGGLQNLLAISHGALQQNASAISGSPLTLGLTAPLSSNNNDHSNINNSNGNSSITLLSPL